MDYQSVACVGLDCHRTFSRLTLRDAAANVLARGRWNHRDRLALGESMRRLPPGTPVVLEGTFGWAWMSDELLAAQLLPQLASSRKLAGWRKARNLPKSDRLDADLLSELPSERTSWWRVWLAPPAVRTQRELLRHRMALVRSQTAMKNRVHALLHRHGILLEHSDLFGAAGRRELQRLIGPGAELLPAPTQFVLRSELQTLDGLRRQIAAATRAVRREVQRSPVAERLRSLPGISYVLAYTIAGEVGDFARFASASQLASYSLLAPRANESGTDDASNPGGRHLGQAGSRTLKWAWLEAAHGAVRAGGYWRELFERHIAGGRRDRQHGYIRVAHRLCQVAFACVRREQDYQESPPPRPGGAAWRRRNAANAATQNIAITNAAMQNVAATNAAMQNVATTNAAVQNVATTNAAVQNVAATNAAVQNVAATNAAMQNVATTNAAVQNVATANAVLEKVATTKAAAPPRRPTNQRPGVGQPSQPMVPVGP